MVTQTRYKKRGIINNGNTCHIACALQLIYHCLPGFVNWLFMQDTSENEVKRALVSIFLKLSLVESDTGLDASDFYALLKGWDGEYIDVNKEGDAVSMLWLILEKAGVDEAGEVCGLNGTILQTISIYSGMNGKLLKERVKERSFCLSPFPLSISIDDKEEDKQLLTLEHVLKSNLITPQTIITNDDTNIKKTVYLSSLPQHILFHVKRFNFDLNDKQILKVMNPIKIPSKLSLSPYLLQESDMRLTDEQQEKYIVTGAILHEGLQAKDGHYIIYVRNDNNEWILLDDEKFENFGDEDQVLNILSNQSSDEVQPRSTIALIYSKQKYEKDNIMNELESSWDDIIGKHDLWNDSELMGAMLKTYFCSLDDLTMANKISTMIPSLLFKDILLNKDWNNVSLATRLMSNKSVAKVTTKSFLAIKTNDLCKSFENVSEDLASRILIQNMFQSFASEEHVEIIIVVEHMLNVWKELYLFDNVSVEAIEVTIFFINAVMKGIHDRDELRLCSEYVCKFLDTHERLCTILEEKSVVLLDLIQICSRSTHIVQYQSIVDFVAHTRLHFKRKNSKMRWNRFISDFETSQDKIEFSIAFSQLHNIPWKVLLALLKIDDCLQNERVSFLVNQDILKKSWDSELYFDKTESHSLFLLRLLKSKQICTYFFDSGQVEWLTQGINKVLSEENLEEKPYRLTLIRYLGVLSNSSNFTNISDKRWHQVGGYDSEDDPNEILDWRVSVRWAKGKYYDGIINSYDEMTGKHEVLYDDGDIKFHNLLKKNMKILENINNAIE